MVDGKLNLHVTHLGPVSLHRIFRYGSTPWQLNPSKASGIKKISIFVVYILGDLGEFYVSESFPSRRPPKYLPAGQPENYLNSRVTLDAWRVQL